MKDSQPSSSTDPQPAVEKTPDKVAKASAEPLYRLLTDCYGMSTGDERSAVNIYQHGVTPGFLIHRGFAELV